MGVMARTSRSKKACASTAPKPRKRSSTVREALQQARKAEERLRAAIDALPEGVVFLDEEFRYILCNERYSEIYKKSADLFQPGARLTDTLRVGVARVDYPEAEADPEGWIAERLAKLANPQGPHEQLLSDGRWILIEERRMPDGCTIGLRVDVTEIKKREQSFHPTHPTHPLNLLAQLLPLEMKIKRDQIANLCHRFLL